MKRRLLTITLIAFSTLTLATGSIGALLYLICTPANKGNPSSVMS